MAATHTCRSADRFLSRASPSLSYPHPSPFSHYNSSSTIPFAFALQRFTRNNSLQAFHTNQTSDIVFPPAGLVLHYHPHVSAAIAHASHARLPHLHNASAFKGCVLNIKTTCRHLAHSPSMHLTCVYNPASCLARFTSNITQNACSQPSSFPCHSSWSLRALQDLPSSQPSACRL